MKLFELIEKNLLAEDIYELKVYAPVIAASARPGQFVILINDAYGERIPLTIYDYDAKTGMLGMVIQAIGLSTKKIVARKIGECYNDIVGPLGNASELLNEHDIRKKNVLFIAGGIGTAPVYPQVKMLQQMGVHTEVIIGARTADLIILENKFKQTGTTVHVCTDDGSRGFKGNVAQMLTHLIQNENKKYDQVVTIGPMIMMKFVALECKKYNIPCIASLNTLMIDGTGMCGACRVTVDGKTRFTCVDGPEFDAHKVDFDEALSRLREKKEKDGSHACRLDKTVDSIQAAEKKRKAQKIPRVPVREQDPETRKHNFEEVCYGYNITEAMTEATRCIQCKKPSCVDACPVAIDIPGFILQIEKANFTKSYQILNAATNLPAVCGRVCPQESQCEGSCVLGVKGEPVSIGKLERFIGDWALENITDPPVIEHEHKERVAVIGSGPAGLSCAGDLRKLGYQVTVFEALQKPGGVLQYGIPEFRLPKDNVVEPEIEKIRQAGVAIETNHVIGKCFNINDLLKTGYDAVFIGTGAGLPRFMDIPGENLNGVYSANEFLTRVNLMKAFRDDFDTPVVITPEVVVVGGGNVAMDAARTAKRLGANVKLVYRRSMEELPARVEEVHHAIEEGIEFHLLTNPVEILGDEHHFVTGIKCVKMQLGAPDSSGRRRPEVIPDSEYIIETGTVIMSIGTSPQPIISLTAPDVQLNKWRCIDADNDAGQTSQEGVFAGGDVVTGAATVILAMGAGKRSAQAIHKYIQNKKK